VPSPAVSSGDDELARRAAAGDEPAFEELVGRYEERAWRLATRLLGGEADAGDVLQEAFLSAYRHLGSFRGDARFSTWLFRIVTNAALMHLRSARRRPVEPLDGYLPRFDAQGRHAEEPAALEAPLHVEERLDRAALAARAREGLQRLPDNYRAAFGLRDLEELPPPEVADLLGVGADVVRQRVHRARLMLRGYLAGLGGGGR
jgi:RNA polymerase sigma-70 factor (ECF subfamily)